MSNVASADDNGLVSRRSNYFDLSVNGAALEGGCSAWTSFVGSGIRTASFYYKPHSLALLVATSIADPATMVSCSDRDAVASILAFLQADGSSSRSSNSTAKSVRCAGEQEQQHVWKLQTFMLDYMHCCKRIGIEQGVAVVGGVAMNKGFINILEQDLGFKVFVPAQPQAVAALGAAIIAKESAEKGAAA